MSPSLLSVFDADGCLLDGAPRAAAGPSEVADLTAGMTSGDEESYRRFHRAYAGRLRRYLWVVCRGDDDAAEEALQQTLLRVVRHVRRFEDEAGFWRWLAALARSAATDGARRRHRYAAALARLVRAWQPAPAEPDPDGPLRRLEAHLEAALGSLPPDERELLVERHRAGTPVRDLARTAGISEKAMESRLARLRQKLRDRLQARLREDPDA